MPKAMCEELRPQVSQEVYECRDNVLYVKIQNLWQCSLAGHTWLEWRDANRWQNTKKPCVQNTFSHDRP